MVGGALVTLSVGCASAPRSSDANLDAILWVQTSAEYGAVTRSVYAAALRDLPELLADSTESAALEQEGAFGGLPPAVILDVDETVLDNVAYQARVLVDQELYASDSWAAWVEERAADPVPGSLEFTRGADSLGVVVFNVTNRRPGLEEATRDNLEALGFPLKQDVDVVLTREGGGSKSGRRVTIAGRYRVIMLVGDDLGDFVDVDGMTLEEREAVVRRYRDYWGRQWRMLPNPTYGSWERVLFDSDFSLSPAERTKRKSEHLETERS
jgi:acid phosphatase